MMKHIMHKKSFLFVASMLLGAPCSAAPLPDLVPSSISYSSATGNFTSVIANQGNAPTPTGVTIGVAYLVDGVKCSWGYVNNAPLAAGASVTIGTEGGACTISNGTHTIAVVADDADRIQMSTRANNTLSQSITLLPDLVPTSLSYNSATGNFTSVIANQGNAATPTGVTIGTAYLVDGVKCTWGYVNNAPLAAGASVTIGTEGGACTISPGMHTIAVVADDVGRIQMSTRANNTLAKTITVGGSSSSLTIASLTAHNTSAYPSYNQINFPPNFGTTSYVSQTQTVKIDPTKMDISMNPVTPGHVSRTNVHSLIPKRPDLRWFAHVLSWWNGFSGGINNTKGQTIYNGTVVNSTSYIQTLINDLINRGFNGVFFDWGGANSASDQMVQKAKTYIATLPAGTFTYAVLPDQGIIDGLPANQRQATFDAAVKYIKTTYWGDTNYEKDGGVPLLPMYGIRNTIGSAAAMSAVKANYGGYWMDVSPLFIGESWADGAYDWHDAWSNGVSQADPYNLSTIHWFLSTVAPYAAKHSMGAMAAGTNGTLTGGTGWALGYYLQQDGGKCIIARANYINANIPSNVTRMQWVTWNDYMEGTAVEPAIENNVTVTTSIQGSTLNWTYTSGTGDESTIDHYEVYASADDINAVDLGSMSAGLHAFSLQSVGLTSGEVYNIMVVAVGKPSIRDHISNSVSFTAP
jgi:hypothetical protein